MGGKWEVQTWGGREFYFEKKKLFFHLEKEAFFASLFLGQTKVWDPRATLAAGTRDVCNVMAEWVMCVESFLCTDHDSVWQVQLRKLVSKDAGHRHLNGAPRKIFLIWLRVLSLQRCCTPAIGVVSCCTSTTVVIPTKYFGTIYVSPLSLYQLDIYIFIYHLICIFIALQFCYWPFWSQPWVLYGVDIWIFFSFPSIYPTVASNI